MEQSIQDVLRDLPRLGTLVKARPYRQIWRFAVGNKSYYLKFYPRPSRWVGWMRPSRAIHEMTRLQWLQKSNIPAPRSVGVLLGFHLDGCKGDALLTEAIEPSVTLEQALVEASLAGDRPDQYHAWVQRVIELLGKLASAGLGHDDLHLGNFLLKDGQVYLIDASAVRRGGLRASQLLLLEHSARPWLSRTDRFRAWTTIGPPQVMPRRNPISQRLWHKFLSRITSDNRYFGELTTHFGPAYFMCRYPRAQRWSRLSRCTLDAPAMSALWPMLDPHGELTQARQTCDNRWAAEVVVDGRPVALTIRRVRRARRLWRNAWQLVLRGIPTPWPLAIIGRQWLICEKVGGARLADLDLDQLDSDARRRLFYRLGHLVRELFETELHHPSLSIDSFMMVDDTKTGPVPVLVDIAPIRARRGQHWSLPSLLASLKTLPGYTPQDSFRVCSGYAPGALIRPERI